MTSQAGQTGALARTEGERIIRQFEIINLVLAVLTVVVVHVLAGPGAFLWGALVGGALGVLNLRGMVFLGRRILKSRTRSRGVWMALFGVKLVLLSTVVWLCLSQLPIEPLGFLVGFSTPLPSSLVLTAVRALEGGPAQPAAPAGGSGPAALGQRQNATPSHGERRL